MRPEVSTINLNIAGVTFRVHSSIPLHLVGQNSPYRQFLDACTGPPESPTIEVRLRLGQVPRTDGLELVFGDRSWSLFRDTVFYHLEFHSSIPDQPLWAARFAENPRRVRLFGSMEMLQQLPTGPAVLNPLCYPLDQILLVYFLAHNSGLLVHAAGAIIGGVALVFPGHSGAGKTTLTRQLLASEYVRLLSDDRVVVRSVANRFYAFGTPWPGEAGVALNEGAPLAGMCFLSHGSENRIMALSPKEAVWRLLQVCSIPWYNATTIDPVLRVCESLLLRVPAFELSFTPSESPAPLLREFTRALPRP